MAMRKAQPPSLLWETGKWIGVKRAVEGLDGGMGMGNDGK
jgi:hypothetical protein